MFSFIKSKILKRKYLLIALPFLLMSGVCNDDSIQVEVVDSFVNTFHIVDQGDQSEFLSTGEVDLAELVEKHGDILKSSYLESATITLREYDASSITVAVVLKIGDKIVVDNSYALTNNQAVNLELVNSLDLINEIKEDVYVYTFSADSETPINDNDFFIDITSKVKVTIETN